MRQPNLVLRALDQYKHFYRYFLVTFEQTVQYAQMSSPAFKLIING